MISIRPAQPTDIQHIVRFNAAMALETEDLQLDMATLEKGVRHLFDHPEQGFYLVAEQDHKVTGCLLITFEWSDWRNGLFWWIQSVYVDPDHRRQGIYSRLYQEIQDRAAMDDEIIGFRLYVERENHRAQQTYKAQGMSRTPYVLFEELKDRRESP